MQSFPQYLLHYDQLYLNEKGATLCALLQALMNTISPFLAFAFRSTLCQTGSEVFGQHLCFRFSKQL